MTTHSSSWHVVIQVVCLVLEGICYVNGQLQCTCLRRSGWSRNCATCDARCFLSDRKCFKCPENCLTCISASYCEHCLTGFYGTSCEHSCSSCKNGQCSKKRCMQGCADGYYLTQGGCEGCPSECNTCTSSSDCTGCKPGYFGPICQYNCYSCKYNACYKDNGKCTEGCAYGYYQPQGQVYCVACPSICDKCNSGTNCTSCKSKYYGPSCDSKCDPNCLYEFCNSKTGECTNGCREGYYQNGSRCLLKCQINFCQICKSGNQFCSVCNNGYYSFNGTCLHCSDGCVNGYCDKLDGRCYEGCIDGLTSRYCNDQCYPNCIACEQSDKETCTSCKPGYHGRKCDLECNTQCREVRGVRQCAKTNGECTHGCTHGYRGPTCDVPCEAGCQDGCDRDTGTCDRCKALYYGPSCEYTCNYTCYNPNNGSSVCDKQTGTCSLSCPQRICESLELDQSLEDVSSVTTPVIIAATTGFVACLVLCVMGIVIFVLVRRKRRNTSNAEQTNETLENNADTVYSVLDHADQGRTTDYTALHTLRGQPQEVQGISSPPTDGNNATYVNAEDTSTEPAKDSYENVFI